MNNTVKLTHGPNSLASSVFVGLTLDELIADDTVNNALSLTGNEAVQVRSVGGTDFTDRPADYVTKAGDEVRFSRAAGTKG